MACTRSISRLVGSRLSYSSKVRKQLQQQGEKDLVALNLKGLLFSGPGIVKPLYQAVTANLTREIGVLG